MAMENVFYALYKKIFSNRIQTYNSTNRRIVGFDIEFPCFLIKNMLKYTGYGHQR